MPTTVARKKQLEELSSLPVNNSERFENIERDLEGLKNAARLQSEESVGVLNSLTATKNLANNHEQRLVDLTKQMESVLAFLQKAKSHMVP